MSRSNPHESGMSNPAERWFEWNGEGGSVRYYDKAKGEQVNVGADFTFILLDELSSVGGWHEASQSAIYSNEVRDTTRDVLVVRAFKGGTLVEGFYKDMKDRLTALGGRFVKNCYIAFKDGDEFKIGSLRFKGAAVRAWFEFAKEHRSELYTKAIRIKGSTSGKKGRVTFKVPNFQIVPVSEETHHIAVALDATLQAYLKGYLTTHTHAQAETAGDHLRDEDVAEEEVREYAGVGTNADDDVPF